jgi:hypothetical protein
MKTNNNRKIAASSTGTLDDGESERVGISAYNHTLDLRTSLEELLEVSCLYRDAFISSG